MRRLIPTAALIAAAVGIGAPATAEARSYTIKTNSSQVTQLGPLYTGYNRNQGPTVGQAIRAFGQPSNRFHMGGRYGGCVVKWKRLGLRIEFWNFGAGYDDICDADAGLAQSFTIERSKKWRTWNGLRIGMTERQLWDLHPGRQWVDDDKYVPDSYWLHQHWQPFGDSGYVPTVYAIVNTNVDPGYGKVKRFYGWIGAAGE